MSDLKRAPKKHPKSNVRFWLARCGSSAKGGLIFALVCAFVGQTFLVYADASETVELQPLGVAGRQIWHTNNCQACHQMYGFGGFLGPDLTNAASRIERSQLAAQLSRGEGQMPRFDMSEDEIDALWAFLETMDETGIGQARNPDLVEHGSVQDAQKIDALGRVIEESGSSEVAAGFELFQNWSCVGCHVLYGQSAVGAPDLSRSGATLEPESILEVLEHGRLPRMPPSGLEPDQRASMQAFITFMGEHREETLERVVEESSGSFWSSVPWWEFE